MKNERNEELFGIICAAIIAGLLIVSMILGVVFFVSKNVSRDVAKEVVYEHASENGYHVELSEDGSIEKLATEKDGLRMEAERTESGYHCIVYDNDTIVVEYDLDD